MMADYKLGVSILKREDESLKDYLLSFSPFAPFFGVPYRFTAATGFDPFAFVPKPATAEQTPAPAPKARKSKATQPVEDAVEAATASADAAAEVATTAAETTAEIVATAAETAAEAASEMTEAAADGAPALLYATAPAAVDDLKQIKGIGPKLERELNGMGLYTFAQMASLTEANLVWVDQNLTAFRGRSVRDDWVGQASALLGS